MPKDGRDETGALGGLEEIVGFHIRLAHGACYRRFMEMFTHLDLTQKQVSVLWLVAEHPGIGQSDLSRRLQMDRATVMAIVNRLEARGYLLREEHGMDARRRALRLSEEGRTALADARTGVARHEAWLGARFTRRETEQLVELLSRIHG